MTYAVLPQAWRWGKLLFLRCWGAESYSSTVWKVPKDMLQAGLGLLGFTMGALGVAGVLFRDTQGWAWIVFGIFMFFRGSNGV